MVDCTLAWHECLLLLYVHIRFKQTHNTLATRYKVLHPVRVNTIPFAAYLVSKDRRSYSSGKVTDESQVLYVRQAAEC